MQYLADRSLSRWLVPAFLLVAATPPALAQTQIAVAPLAKLAIELERSVPATVVSLRTATVSSELSAQVVRMDLVPGDLVSKGAPIAFLDCRDSELLLRSAQSQVAALQARQKLARQQLARLNKLKQSLNASEDQINQQQAELDVVTAEIATQGINIATAEQRVARCVIDAPFSGLITATPGQVGNYLVPGSPVASLVDIDFIELKAGMLENQVEEVKINAPWFEFAGNVWPLALRTIFPVIDEATQTRQMRFRFPGAKPAPGSAGRLRWRLNGLTLPSAYIVERNNEAGIFMVESKTADRVRFLPVENARPGQPVTLNLPPDTLVVTDGRFGLEHDQEVEIP